LTGPGSDLSEEPVSRGSSRPRWTVESPPWRFPFMKAVMAWVRSRTEPKVPRRMAWRVMIPKNLDHVQPRAVPLTPDPGHGGKGDLQLGGQQPRRPVRHAQVRWRPAFVGDRGDHDVDLVDLRWPSTARQIIQRADSPGVVTGAPIQHSRPAGPGPARDLGVGQPLGGQQRDPRPPRQARRHRTRP